MTKEHIENAKQIECIAYTVQSYMTKCLLDSNAWDRMKNNLIVL